MIKFGLIKVPNPWLFRQNELRADIPLSDKLEFPLLKRQIVSYIMADCHDRDKGTTLI